MVIALDVGTSSARAAFYDGDARPIAGRSHQMQYTPRLTRDGGVEHDANRLLEAVVACLDAIHPNRPPEDTRAVGVATFWHGLLGFDASGHAITPVYMWADVRSAAEAEVLRSALDDEAVHARTGCHLHSSYWPAKLRWLAREYPVESSRVARWGSFGEFLELNLFGEATTSVSMASGTGLLDQATSRWDLEALAAAAVDERRLFPLSDRADPRRGLRAPWASRWPALRTATWYPAVGDGAASNVGSDCVDPTRIALNVGTSAALRVMGSQHPVVPRGLWRYRVDRTRAIVGGATSEGGNIYAWCRQVLRLGSDEEVEAALAALPPDGHGLTILPHLAGERSPGWRDGRRGAIAGLRLDTSGLDIVRAALESVALRLAAVYRLLAPCASDGHTIVASGAALGHSRAWTQMIADAIGRPVAWSTEPEATGRGAAVLALEALRALPDLSAARRPTGETFVPQKVHHVRYLEALERQRRLDERV
ncbi:MAG: carbohydrate kinase [Candidatus Rokuibacteriota bacterium]|nr:MAG: carbohydrate kinase [Candidatus Rokubacteria bacterium]